MIEDYLEKILWTYMFFVMIATFGVAIYGIVFKPNMLKKIIALTIFGDTANVFMIFVGYRAIYPIKPPVLWTMKPDKNVLNTFVSQTIDPVPPALVITAIVINMAITLLITFLAIQAYRLYGSLDVRDLSKLKG